MSMTSAPPAWRVRTRLAVSAVTCRQADKRRPLRGFSRAKRSRIRARTGMSWSAHRRRFLPCGARSGLAMSDGAAIERSLRSWGNGNARRPSSGGGPRLNRRSTEPGRLFQGSVPADAVPDLLELRSDIGVELIGEVAGEPE